MTSLSTISVSASRKRFDRFAGELARTQGADMLLSTDGFPAQTESLVGVEPVAELIFTDKTTPDNAKAFCFGTPGPTFGFISYDFGMLLRGVGSAKKRGGPLGHLRKYAATIKFDNGAARIQARSASLARDLAAALERTPDADSAPAMPAFPETPPTASLDRAGYEAGVRETLERILSGHTYQLNLSTRFSRRCPGLDPLALLLTLRRRHPAPFYAWFSSGPRRILSTSPERFLRVSDGQILSQPIKGTARLEGDRTVAENLLKSSDKESAELSMIVDLIRNDISANSEYGSVRVENHKSVFAVDNLLQMYSDVRGTLRADRDCLDLFFDAFPGGSITGCPKKRSMEIIEELEPHTRNVYCGAMAVIRDRRNMDSSIAIRTAIFDVETEFLDFFAGSGIVVDSDPAKEYLETLAKAEKFLSLEKT
ncbi:anthranilate synthase component I family protein [Pseudodesulfovibrio thermohalotolerans]|uniref:anthranilate synthase component I family protein n=1 Tax=Pseudodesulfovibrio thermohalotolerans TaxID=2880651 RepID=UPI002442D886|nr:anthranilate synthase component I family protein [Pseudodesulfovibrio thermohalotolerans]WFS62618.1 anthranilate synthase component I family protein [Pseudodesulfovibrio thermohalotolerans]